jgi:hypothetical protein
MQMKVQTRSFRGFKIVGRRVTQAAIDDARAECEGVLQEHGITAADIRNLEHKFADLGQSGLDLQMKGQDWKRYGVDPKHVRANKHLFEVLSAARKTGAVHAGSVISFQPDPVHT